MAALTQTQVGFKGSGIERFSWKGRGLCAPVMTCHDLPRRRPGSGRSLSGALHGNTTV